MRVFLPAFLLLMLGLAACSSEEAAKTYTYVPLETPGGRLCTGQCGEARDYCRQTCSLNHRECYGKVQTQALQDYDAYTREQYASHQEIDLLPRDFERTGRCDSVKKDCDDDCEDHYRTCYQNCGGKINTTTSCQSFCF